MEPHEVIQEADEAVDGVRAESERSSVEAQLQPGPESASDASAAEVSQAEEIDGTTEEQRREAPAMDERFARLMGILAVMALGYSILSNPGPGFVIDLDKLKGLLMYILLGGGTYAIYVTYSNRNRRPPPGV